MSEIVLKVVNENFVLNPGKWVNTSWTIRDDQSAIVNVRYDNNSAKDKDFDLKIAEDKFEQIFELLEKAKQQDSKIFALDGDGWEFTQYKDGKKIYYRRSGYIYGLDYFELLADLLYKIIKPYAGKVR